MPQFTLIYEIMHSVGTQKALDKWKRVFDLVSSLVSQDTINTKRMRKRYPTTSGKCPGMRSCSETLAGRDKRDCSYCLEQAEVLTALAKRKGSTMKEERL